MRRSAGSDLVEALAREPHAGGRCAEYVASGARDGRHRGGGRRRLARRPAPAPRVLRDVTARRHGRPTLLGSRLRRRRWGSRRRPCSGRSTRTARSRWPAARPRRAAPRGLLSNAGAPSFDDRRPPARTWWLQAYLAAGPGRQPCRARGGGRGRGVGGGADRRHPGARAPSTAAGSRGIWEGVDLTLVPGQLRPSARADPVRVKAARPRAGRHRLARASTTGLPVVVKGVLRPDDARRCVEAGAGAVWVSNHGGRQLDRAAATCDGAAGRRGARSADDAEVYVDGGITRRARRAGRPRARRRRGLRRAARGATRSPPGEPRRWPRRWTRVTDELVEAMRLAGCPTPARHARDRGRGRPGTGR